jgi:hypothetical protein
MRQTTPLSKPRSFKSNYFHIHGTPLLTKSTKAEHVFEFQIFSIFVHDLLGDPRNAALTGGCSGTW